MTTVHIEDLDIEDLRTVSLHKLHKLVSAYETLIEDEDYDPSTTPEELIHLALTEQQSWNNAHTAWANEHAY